jgi:hypothetical protein
MLAICETMESVSVAVPNAEIKVDVTKPCVSGTCGTPVSASARPVQRIKTLMDRIIILF